MASVGALFARYLLGAKHGGQVKHPTCRTPPAVSSTVPAPAYRLDELHRALAREITWWRKRESTTRGHAVQLRMETRRHKKALTGALGVSSERDMDEVIACILRLRADLAQARLDIKKLRAFGDD